MQAPPFPILYEDNHLLVVVKPAGIATMGVPAEGTGTASGAPRASSAPSALELARQYIKSKYKKPGNVYLGVVSRLDAPVSGVLLFARTSKAAARLTELFRTRAVEKTYWAAIEGEMAPPKGTLVDWLVHHERHRRVQVAPQGAAGAKEARLDYKRLTANEEMSLIEVELQTGRKHQIRVQFASRGHPIVGDRKYGSGVSFPAGIALHARRLAGESSASTCPSKPRCRQHAAVLRW
jgi:23S rRNA pseudouridine1911/1915/1917 synthase